jgi:hypothetical protein
MPVRRNRDGGGGDLRKESRDSGSSNFSERKSAHFWTFEALRLVLAVDSCNQGGARPLPMSPLLDLANKKSVETPRPRIRRSPVLLLIQIKFGRSVL